MTGMLLNKNALEAGAQRMAKQYGYEGQFDQRPPKRERRMDAEFYPRTYWVRMARKIIAAYFDALDDPLVPVSEVVEFLRTHKLRTENRCVSCGSATAMYVCESADRRSYGCLMGDVVVESWPDAIEARFAPGTEAKP